MLWLILFSTVMGLFLIPFVLIAMGMALEDIGQIIRSPLFLIAYQLLVLLAPFLLWVYAKRESFRNFLKFEPLDLTNIAIIVGITLLMQPAMMFVSGLTGLFFPNLIVDVVMGLMDYPFWLVMLAIAVTPAIIEELIFRGYIQTQYEGFGIKKAAIISGLFFGIIHMNMQQFFYAFIAGVVFTYIVYYTKSIMSGILAHFVMNGSQMLMLRMVFIAENEMQTVYDAAPIPEISPLVTVVAIGIFALLTTPPAILLLKKLINRCKAEHEFDETITVEAEPQNTEANINPFKDAYRIAVVAIYVTFNILFFAG